MRCKAVASLGLAVSAMWVGAVAAADKPSPTRAPKPAPTAMAAPADSAPSLDEESRRQLQQFFKTYVVPRFTAKAEDLPDGELHAAAVAMQAEHLPRVQALMDRWMLEELQQRNPQWALRRVQSRLVNEFALWGRDSMGPAQDAALAQALQIPGMCHPPVAQPGELAMRLWWLRGLAPELRQQAVQAERELLARWGQARQVSDAEPLAAEEMLLQLRATGIAPRQALPPMLAYFYLGEVDDKRRDPLLMQRSTRCALQQWAGANPAQFRAAMAMEATDLVWSNRRDGARPAADDDPYPRVANYFGARGLITLQGDVDTDGRLVRAKVVKREVSVPGIRDARPFAFENSLDLASLAKAREMDWSAATPKQGVNTVRREFQWSLKWE